MREFDTPIFAQKEQQAKRDKKQTALYHLNKQIAIPYPWVRVTGKYLEYKIVLFVNEKTAVMWRNEGSNNKSPSRHGKCTARGTNERSLLIMRRFG